MISASMLCVDVQMVCVFVWSSCMRACIVLSDVCLSFRFVFLIDTLMGLRSIHTVRPLKAKHLKD